MGKDCLGEVRKNQKKEVPDGRGQERFRDLFFGAMCETVHRPKIGGTVQTKGKEGPPDELISIRTEGTTVQMCGDSNVAEKWIDGHYAMGQKVSRTKWPDSENTASVVEKKICV